METVNPCSQFINFLFGLRVNEIPNMTFILDSYRPIMCSSCKLLFVCVHLHIYICEELITFLERSKLKKHEILFYFCPGSSRI
jgi:hypothetical protein